MHTSCLQPSWGDPALIYTQEIKILENMVWMSKSCHSYERSLPRDMTVSRLVSKAYIPSRTLHPRISRWVNLRPLLYCHCSVDQLSVDKVESSGSESKIAEHSLTMRVSSDIVSDARRQPKKPFHCPPSRPTPTISELCHQSSIIWIKSTLSNSHEPCVWHYHKLNIWC